MKRLAVLLSGRGSNFIKIYENIKSGVIKNAEIVLVISNKQDAPGLAYARQAGLNAIYLNPKDYPDREEYDRAIVDLLKREKIDLVCLAGYMRIITKFFVESFPNRIINIHPSLLPAFPGLDAQKQALEYGVKYTGCTVHFVDEKVDHGAIILQEVVEVLDDDSVETLSARILQKEHIVYSKAIDLIVNDKIYIDGRTVKFKKV
ncbi:phosphoribosylglycinamide formyltransferase [Calditerrivibrio nitroreducens]|uniref:Phosphoribosylglycinamide formyltransferase n=1 Tax=Calditerrivibrio nitroreducens (strain DSM 19672 / NBRC 101217 / Yu37-1) TaxID=768670 RepID=E4TG21_CALNY|nr:phosphoribosylglycinamide formyltransferase [Calditerrivibrio nitroreducens]ADR18571.1 formyltetrahydrofolate-dependent phosphoribosylglycinamide formyltransferase [Calditerrivibrio nitroreducens DSM 19672]